MLPLLRVRQASKKVLDQATLKELWQFVQDLEEQIGEAKDILEHVQQESFTVFLTELSQKQYALKQSLEKELAKSKPNTHFLSLLIERCEEIKRSINEYRFNVGLIHLINKNTLLDILTSLEKPVAGQEELLQLGENCQSVNIKNDFGRVIDDLLKKAEKYKNSSAMPDVMILMETYGFALALIRRINNSDNNIKKELEDKIVETIEKFVPKDLRGKQDIALANFADCFRGFQVRLENFRADAKAYLTDPGIKSAEQLNNFLAENQVSFEGLINDIFEYLHGIVPNGPKTYAILSVGSLATQMVTPYSDIEYVVLVDEFTDEAKTYFTNFGDLFELMMIGLGESPINKARILLQDFEPYFKYIKKGTRVDEHKKPQDMNRLFGLINTPRALLCKLPNNIIHQTGNHLTAALLTVGQLDKCTSSKLYKAYHVLFEQCLPTKEYFECSKKLLEQGLRECTNHIAFLKKILREQPDEKQEIKKLLVHPLHLVRELAVFLRCCGENITLESNPLTQIQVLKQAELLTEIEALTWSQLITWLLRIRLELQMQNDSTEAKLSLKELDEQLIGGIKEFFNQLELISRLVERHKSDRITKESSTSIKEIIEESDGSKTDLSLWHFSLKARLFLKQFYEEVFVSKLYENAYFQQRFSNLLATSWLRDYSINKEYVSITEDYEDAKVFRDKVEESIRTWPNEYFKKNYFFMAIVNSQTINLTEIKNKFNACEQHHWSLLKTLRALQTQSRLYLFGTAPQVEIEEHQKRDDDLKLLRQQLQQQRRELDNLFLKDVELQLTQLIEQFDYQDKLLTLSQQLNLALLYLKQKQPEKVIEHIQSVLQEISPNTVLSKQLEADRLQTVSIKELYVCCYNLMGKARRQQVNNFNDATQAQAVIAAYKTGLDSVPDDYPTLSSLAAFYDDLKDYKEAQVYHEKALQVFKERGYLIDKERKAVTYSNYSWNIYHRAHLAQDDKEKTKLLEKAKIRLIYSLELSPNAGTHLYFAKVDLALADISADQNEILRFKTDALHQLHAGLLIEPENAKLLVERAELYLQFKENDKANEDANMASILLENKKQLSEYQDYYVRAEQVIEDNKAKKKRKQIS